MSVAARLKDSPVQFSKTRGGYVDRRVPQRRLMGLLPMLEECFWRDFKYKPDREAAAASTDKTSSKAGRRRGILVDQQLSALVAGKKVPKLHSFTRRGWLLLARKKYVPLATQVGVTDPQLAIGTAADMVCGYRDRQGVVLVEVKSSKSHYFKKGSGQLLWPYQKQTNSPFNQAQLQLGWTCRMFRKQFPKIAVRGAFVMRIHKAGVATYPLRPWVLSKENRKLALAKMRAKRFSKATKMRRTVLFKRPKTRFARRR